MGLVSELFALMVLIGLVALSVALANSWTRRLATLLWQLALAPAVTSLSTLLAVILFGTAIRLIWDLSLTGPLAFAAQLVAVPFIAVPLCDYLAFRSAARRRKAEPLPAWRGFIFAVRREAQRAAYEAPSNGQ